MDKNPGRVAYISVFVNVPTRNLKVNEQDIEQLILDALADNRYKWRTLHGLAAQVGVPENEVLQVITNNSDRIVQSSIPSTEGSTLFTTREHFHQMSSPLEKIVGAFKGRIR